MLINPTVTHRRCSSLTGQRSGHPIGVPNPVKLGRECFQCVRFYIYVRHVHMGQPCLKEKRKEKRKKKRKGGKKRKKEASDHITLPMTQPTATTATQFHPSRRREHLEKPQTTLVMFSFLSTSTIVRVMPQCENRKERFSLLA